LSTTAPSLSEDADECVKKIILLRLLKLNSIGLAAHAFAEQYVFLFCHFIIIPNNSLLSFHRMQHFETTFLNVQKL